MEKIRKKFESMNIIHYIFVFSIMVLVVIATMGSYLYYTFYRNTYSDFLTSNEEHLLAIVRRHEDDMQIMENIRTQIGLSDNVTKFKLSEQPYKSTQLQNQLYQYTIVSQFFSMVLYTYYEDTYLYNHATSIGVDYFVNNAFLLENTSSQELKEYIYADEGVLFAIPEQGMDGYWMSRYIGDPRVVLYVMPLSPQYKDSLLFVVSDSYYDELLENISENRRADYIFCDEKVIVARGEQILDQDVLIAELDHTDGQKRITLDGEKYLLSVQHGESGLVYCSLQSMNIFYSRLLTSQWGIFFLLLICTVPTALLIVQISQNIGRKMRKMNLLLNISEEETYNLNNIEEGILLLVRANEEKEKENRELKKARFIRSFLRGDFFEEKQAKQMAESLEIKVDYSLYLVLLMGERSDSNENEAHEKMLNTIAQTAHLDGYGIHLVSNNQSVMVLFGDTREQIGEVLGRLFAIGKEYYEEFIMAASNYHTNLTEGAKAYLEADTAFDNRFLQDNNKIIWYSEIKQTGYVDVLPENYLQNFHHAIRHRDKEGVKHAVEAICIKMTKESPSLMTFRLLYNDILHIIISEWKEELGDVENIYNVFTLSQCLTVQDLNNLLYEACSVIISNRQFSEVSGSEVVSKAIAYMQEHFSEEELTMNVLSEYLQISSVTLSVEFKNYMGLRPSDYLANLRIEKAKELLVSSNMLIREISLAVGYADDHVFTRRFKKYTGKTPGQYREEQ